MMVKVPAERRHGFLGVVKAIEREMSVKDIVDVGAENIKSLLEPVFYFYGVDLRSWEYDPLSVFILHKHYYEIKWVIFSKIVLCLGPHFIEILFLYILIVYINGDIKILFMEKNVIITCIGKYNNNSFSGTTKNVGESFKALGFNVIYFGFSAPPLLLKIISRLFLIVANLKGVKSWQLKIQRYYFKKKLNKAIKKYSPEFVIETMCPIVPSKTSCPFFLYTDATRVQLQGYYQDDTANERGSKLIKKYELDESSRIKLFFVSSAWAKNSYINDLNISPNKVFVSLIGPSLDFPHELVERKLDNKEIKLLFIGKDVKRKGLDKAISINNIINQKGIKSTLYVVGNEEVVNKENVVSLGLIENGSEKMKSLLKSSTFFILPTNAECAGIVFAEAAAFGLPSITYSTGGTSEMVINNKTGLCFDPNESLESISEKIISLFQNRNEYKEMSKEAYKYYEEKLNWKTISRFMMEKIEEFL